MKHLKGLLLILGLVFLLLRLPYLRLPLDRDEGGYAYVGWIWSSGQGIPYRSVFDQKPPLTYVPYAIASRLMGNSFLGIRIVAFVYTGLLIISFSLLAFSVLQVIPAFISSLLFIIYISAIGLEGSNFNTEMLLLLPLVLAFTIYFRSFSKSYRIVSLMLTALFGSLAVLFKPVAIFPLGLLGLYEAIRYRKLSNVLLLGISALIPLGVVAWYFSALGALPQMLKYLFYFNSQYIKSGFTPEFICGTKYYTLGCIINWLIRGPIVMAPLTLLSFAIIGKLRQFRSPGFYLALSLFMGDWLAIKDAGSKDFAHYFLLLIPGACLLVGLWLNQLKAISRAKFVIGFLLFWFMLSEGYLHLSSVKLIQASQFGSQANWMEDAVQVADWVNRQSPQQEIIVWANEPEIYYYSQRLAPGGYMHFYAFSYLPQQYTLWLNKLSEKPPQFILTYLDDPASYYDLNNFFKLLPDYQKTGIIGKFQIFTLQTNKI